MIKNYIKEGVKNIILIIIAISLFVGIFLYKFKNKVEIGNYSLDLLNIYWIIATLIFAFSLILVYSFNKQYPNTKNTILAYFKPFNKKDYFVIFSSIFSLNFLANLIFNFYDAMNYRSVYALITFVYLFMIIFGIIVIIIFTIRMLVRFIKKIFWHSRIQFSKDKKDLIKVFKLWAIDGSYITYNIRSKVPFIIKLFNVILYGIFLILLLSIIFTINKPSEVNGKIMTIGEVNGMSCHRYSGCQEFKEYVIGISNNNNIQTFVFSEKEFAKCNWNITKEITLETNPIVHSIPAFNHIKECG